MKKEELIKKITEKKEFSKLPKKDVELVYEKFDKRNINDYQKLKLSRQFLRRLFSSFSSRKLLGENVLEKGNNLNWFLGKHKSTKERFENYKQVYEKCFFDLGKFNLIDLGSGINGLSYEYFKKYIKSYLGVEAVGQLATLQNNYFKKNKIKNARVVHESLFEIEKVKGIIQKVSEPRVIILFKVMDSLELLKRNYTRELLKEIVLMSERVILSFATKSMGSRKKFSVQRGWIINFIKENFNLEKDFEINGERYLVFCKA
ncbi:MAG: hypothetical protein PVJ67_05775 [Candidatus Pacearchaeota archaeon]|jgi:hypothetical protein